MGSSRSIHVFTYMLMCVVLRDSSVPQRDRDDKLILILILSVTNSTLFSYNSFIIPLFTLLVRMDSLSERNQT